MFENVSVEHMLGVLGMGRKDEFMCLEFPARVKISLVKNLYLWPGVSKRSVVASVT